MMMMFPVLVSLVHGNTMLRRTDKHDRIAVLCIWIRATPKCLPFDHRLLREA
jgi:hypothetical protein